LCNLLKQVTDASSNVTTITYDGYGRKTQLIDPNMGDWRYRYDALSNPSTSSGQASPPRLTTAAKPSTSTMMN
jgi:YD repeat-containing protein